MWRKIFKTFLFGTGKKTLERHKGLDKVHSWEEVENARNFGGILLPEYVDISFDDPEMCSVFLQIVEKKEWKCIVLKNKENGHIHTYWKGSLKNGKDIKLACGLVADIHSGDTYIPLNVEGSKRFPPISEPFWDEGEDIEEVPPELRPVKTELNLWKMKEGEGRNDSLYKYILTLSRAKLTQDQIIDMYHTVINPHILADPVNTDELDTILRPEAFPDADYPDFFGANGKFLHNVFARYLQEELHVIKINDQLHIYNGAVYAPGAQRIEQEMCKIIDSLTDRQRKETLKQLLVTTENVQPMPPNYVAFENGILDYQTGNMLSFSPELVMTNQIRCNYNPEAKSVLMDQTLDRVCCNDPAVRQLILEMIGYCFYPSAEYQKAFVLIGEGANGKSVVLDCIKAVLGEQNYSVLDLSETGDRFSTAMLYGKLANLGDDISDEFLQGSTSALFKKIVTGNSIKAENKGQDPFMFKPHCTLIFSANEMPRSKDRTGAVQRRLVMIPFLAKFSEDDPDHDPHITQKLTQREPLEFLASEAVKAFRGVLERGRFTQPEIVKKEEQAYELLNNPIKAFIEERGEELILNQSTGKVYEDYKEYLRVCSLGNPLARTTFSRLMCKELSCDTKQVKVEGRVTRIFIRE